MRGALTGTRASRRSVRTRGQSLVEFALLAPILIVLLVGSAQIGAILYAGISVASAAHDGARVASEQPINSTAFASGGAAGCGTPSNPITASCPATTCLTTPNNPVCEAVAQSKGLLGTVTTTISPSTADTSPACSTKATWVPDGYVTVTVSDDVPIFIPFLNNMLANTSGGSVRTIATTVTMRVEPCTMTQGK
jgi:Flp pilus assembly protein TadG